MQPDEPAPPAAFFLDACAYWRAMRVLHDRADEGASPATGVLLGRAALEAAFKAVLAASGWSAAAWEGLDRDLEAIWVAALDCGLIPILIDETGDLVLTIGSARLGAAGTTIPAGRNTADMAQAVAIVGSLIVDIGEQFESIGNGLR